MAEVPAVHVSDVAKTFRLPTEQVHTIKERALHPLRRPGFERFEALKGVSFEVAKGEFFGIVGRNGSGKSTLLKCLAGIYGVDRGAIHIDGRLSAFIELGVGFNPDLAAADNIKLNATMLGLSPKESAKRIDAVLDFAELREFAELKIKNYSSGMLVRLAFSVMIQVDADVLLIDEVLAVGDASFQQKCFDEFDRIRRSHRTVLFVTHDMGAVVRFCDRALLLEKGNPVALGDAEAVGNRYLELNFSAEARAAARREREEQALLVVEERAPVEVSDGAERYGDGRAEIVEAYVRDGSGQPSFTLAAGTRCTFVVKVRFNEDVEDPMFSCSLRTGAGHTLMAASTVWDDPHLGLFRAGEEVEYRVEFENLLAGDRYYANVSVEQDGHRWLDFRNRIFSVVVTSPRATGALVDLPVTQELQRGGVRGEVAR